jgi:multiple sugar transport system ATP-binding protein
MPSAEVTRRVKETAAQLGLADLLRRRPRQLSGGERQRVALARAIVRDPALFLMDEPLSNLDAKLRTNTRREILRLQRRLEVTTLFVTHDQVEAMTMGTRVAVMNGGELCQVGTPQEIYEWPANTFVAGFVGSPPMNLFSASELTVGETEALRHRGGRGWLVPSCKALSGDRGPYTLGIRPEDIHLAPVESATARGTVDLVEYLGSESVVTVSVDGDDWLLRIPAGAEAVVGEIVGLAVDPQRVHVFDRVDEHVGTLAAHAGSAAHAS